MEKQKKKFTMPDTYVIIVALIVFMIIMTWILPAGQFDTEGRMVLPGTYHAVEQNPAGISTFLGSFFLGMQKGATTIFLILIIGGAFQILIDTGTVSACIASVLKKTHGDYKKIIPCIMIVLAVLGALGCGTNCALAFCGIMLVLAKQLKLDKIAVVAMLYLAANTGFAASPINPFTVLLAQGLAELPPMSGAIPRTIMDILFTAIAIWYTMRYCAKIRNDPSKSLAPFTEEDEKEYSANADTEALTKLSIRQILCLVILVGTFVVFTWGTLQKKWDLPALASCMMAMAFLCGIVGGLSPNEMAKSFVNGSKSMVYSAMLVGFASAINVIMTNANIIHTIVYYLCMPLQYLPKLLSAIGMFLVNFLFNFFVPSGSGQAYVTVPIMVPMADVLGITRQVAVSAFQFGDGLCNALIPTTSLLMGTLGIAKVPFNKWLKFVVPVTGMLAAASMVFLSITTLIAWV